MYTLEHDKQCPDLQRAVEQEQWASLGDKPVPFQWGSRPLMRQGGTVVQGLLSKSEQGLESQNKKHGEQGAPLQGHICRRHLGRWEQSVDLRKKPGSALYHPHPPRAFILGPLAMEGVSAGAASSPSPVCTYLQETLPRVLVGVQLVT